MGIAAWKTTCEGRQDKISRKPSQLADAHSRAEGSGDFPGARDVGLQHNRVRDPLIGCIELMHRGIDRQFDGSASGWDLTMNYVTLSAGHADFLSWLADFYDDDCDQRPVSLVLIEL